jgi:salicylate biosynthesis isochorismate synthase
MQRRLSVSRWSHMRRRGLSYAVGVDAVTQRPGPLALRDRERAELLRRMQRAAKRARRSGAPVLAALGVEVDAGLDPSAIVCASRRDGEPWFLLEQPERDGAARAALGCVAAVQASGPDRFALVARAWRELAGTAICEPEDGLAAAGGFAFAPTGGASPHWAGFAPASLHVGELALVRRGRDVRLTVAALVAPDDDPEQRASALCARVESLRDDPLPLLDPAPAGRYEVVSAAPPEHFEDAVAGAVARIQAGAIEKIVLAREVQVHAPVAHDPAAVFAVLREAFPSCLSFCVGRGGAAFIGATPELLVRRDGLRAGTLALAGSTRRSADPSVDDHLGEQLLRSAKNREEQAIVARRIERTLAPYSVWVTTAPDPVVVRVANIQHLATPIRAQLRAPVAAVELAGALHPTPAVGGEPFDVAGPLIPALEGLDRGWYAGPVGWTDTSEDGEFCVALRCALLVGPVARCYAGVGVVRDSEPAAELAETEIKLQALLPVLAG